MFKEVFKKLQGEISGTIALNHVAEIARHHRIQASPGFRAAARYAADTLRSYGLMTEVLEYPADGKTRYWSAVMHEEWDAKEAELRIVEPKEEARVLARYLENKISLIQRSCPTPKGGVEAELVVLENGEEEEEYKKLDVREKIVLTKGEVGRVYSLAVEKHGAAGIIYDGIRTILPVRPEHELDDALAYTSFWWTKGMKPAFGFVLSPREGARLRALAKKLEKEGKAVKLYSKVGSSIYSGKIENVSALIEGETDEEVVVVAHLCHPQPSANDNASGSGAAMEAARALHALISKGELTKPKRSIRFTLVPEMTGSYAFLATNEEKIPKMVVAINLDMVGENQTLCGGPLIVEKPPEAMSAYVSDLLVAIFEELKMEAKNLAGTTSYALFKHAVSPYSGGSDHAIYSDPSVGIPCPMIIQWPDKFYHTSWDTVDKVDPEMLRKVSLLTATYAYFIANAGMDDALWLSYGVASNFKGEVASLVQKDVTAVFEEAKKQEEPSKFIGGSLKRLKQKVEYRRDRAVERLFSTKRLVKGKEEAFEKALSILSGEINKAAKEGYRNGERALKDYAALIGALPLRSEVKRKTALEKRAEKMVARKVYRGPISTREALAKMSEEDREALRKFQREHRESSGVTSPALYWTNGERNVLEVSKLVELETGKSDLEYLVGYYEFLEKMRVIEIKRA